MYSCRKPYIQSYSSVQLQKTLHPVLIKCTAAENVTSSPNQVYSFRKRYIQSYSSVQLQKTLHPVLIKCTAAENVTSSPTPIQVFGCRKRHIQLQVYSCRKPYIQPYSSVQLQKTVHLVIYKVASYSG